MADAQGSANLGSSDFRGTPRYQILRRIGSGGFGVVYEAIDEVAQTRVALKTLHRLTGDGLFTLKQEFRSLADVFHRNLVALYELTEHEGHWFFTMEYLDGVDFYTHVRPSIAGRNSVEPLVTIEAPRERPEPKANDSDRQPISKRDAHATPNRAMDLPALRNALPQLVDGVRALHELGMLHRDLKPSNVIVTTEGRVVLLDFGLVVEHHHRLDDGTKKSGVETATAIVGTPEYMSPEQSIGDDVGPASDWYAVGTMLYEALVGRRPFHGTVAEVIADRQYNEAPPPSRFAKDLPQDLEALVMSLLERDPQRRPSGADIARIVGAGAPITLSAGQTVGELLIGREAHLANLSDALTAVAPGHPVVCELYGPSGIGKSALVGHFVERCKRDRDVLVFSGRCEERKAVPFKAVDNLIDALSAYLRDLPGDSLARILPPRMDVLARVFPVLPMRTGVQPAIKPPLGDARLGPEAVREDRRLAVEALTELFRRITSQRMVVLVVDDLQWGDEDSAGLLRDLLGAPEAPGLLLLSTFRGDSTQKASPFERSAGSATVDRRVLNLEPIGADQAEALAASLLGRRTPENVEHARRIAKECEGNPFFLGELVRHIRANKDNPEALFASGVSLSTVVRSRVAAIPKSAQSMIELLSIIGVPVAQGLLMDASGQGPEAYGVLRLLRASNFVRFVGGKDSEQVMLYHDRIREAVLASLTADTIVAHHRAIVDSMRRRSVVNSALFATHLAGSGAMAEASLAALDAAEVAESAFAFEAAARWYTKAIAWSASGESLENMLTPKLAFAYSAAGRNGEAATAYRRAAELDPTNGVDYRGRAMFHLLVEGRHDEGLALLHEVSKDVGLSVPSGSVAATASILKDRAWLWLRGSSVKEREVALIPPQTLQRIDLAQNAGLALAFSDSISSTYFLSQFMRLSLSAGEPVRAGMALMRYSTTVAVVSHKGEKRALELLRQAEAISERHRDPYLRACVGIGYGFVDLVLCRWLPCYNRMERAGELLRRVPNAYWELDTASTFMIESSFALGNLAEAIRAADRLARESDARGFVGGQRRHLARYSVFDKLCADNPSEATRGVDEAMKSVSYDRFLFLHYHEVLSRGWITNYEGDGTKALKWIRSRWSVLERSGMHFAQIFRMQSRHLLGCSLVNAAQETKNESERISLLKEASSVASSLESEEMAYPRAHAAAINGCIASIRRDEKRAVAELRRSQELYESCTAMAHSNAIKRLLGLLKADDEGIANIAECDESFRRQTARNPSQLVNIFAPNLKS